MTSLKSVAETLASEFQKIESNQSTRVCLKSNDSNLYHFIRDEIHEGYLPDDFKYAVTFSAIQAITEGRSEDYALGIEPDIYTSDLLSWASSNLLRQEYLDEVLLTSINEGLTKSFFEVLQHAQALEIEEITSMTLAFVESELEQQLEWTSQT